MQREHPDEPVALGDTFGLLTVERHAPPKRSKPRWYCKCACGGDGVYTSGRLTGGKQRSCGCLLRQRREAQAVAAAKRQARMYEDLGPEGRALYGIWYMMIDRCHNPKATRYADYGGRGISVSDRWRFGADGKSGLECFDADMGPRPSRDHQVERGNNDRPYEPGNCSWDTRVNQANNKRNNRFVEHGGKRLTVAQWARIKNVHPATITRRLNAGMSASDALTVPVGSIEPKDAVWVDYDGERVTLAEAARRKGLPYNAVKLRVGRMGWSIERALSHPVRVTARAG